MIESNSAIKIRKGKISDIPQLIRLYFGARELADFAGQKYDRYYFLLVIKSKDCLVLVAEKDGKICGALDAEFDESARYTFLANIIVTKKLRGQGIGGMLLDALANATKKRKYKHILGFVYAWNKNMQKAMKRYGYSRRNNLILYSKAV